MKCRIGRHFQFEACHKLPDEEIYGACSRLHGHRYELDIEIEGNVKSEGWVCNFTELKQIINEHIIDRFDHSNLNDYFEIPTAENISAYIWDTLTEQIADKDYKIVKIKLYETSKCYVELICD